VGMNYFLCAEGCREKFLTIQRPKHCLYCANTGFVTVGENLANYRKRTWSLWGSFSIEYFFCSDCKKEFTTSPTPAEPHCHNPRYCIFCSSKNIVCSEHPSRNIKVKWSDQFYHGD